MVRALLSAALLYAMMSVPSAAQDYRGPAVDACARLARDELRQNRVAVTSVKLVLNEIEKYTRKLGTQFVSSVLTGTLYADLPDGNVKRAKYLCLLADDRTPVFLRLDWVSTSALEETCGGNFECTAREVSEMDRRIDQDFRERLEEAKAAMPVEDFAEYATSAERELRAWRDYRDAACALSFIEAPRGPGARNEQGCRKSMTSGRLGVGLR